MLKMTKSHKIIITCYVLFLANCIAAQQSLLMFEQCPDTEPIGLECSSIGLNCKYGEECCNKLDGDVCKKQCSPSVECTCEQSGWACLVTEFCNVLPPECEIPTCPVPSSGTVCTEEYQPVLCEEQCEYSNTCKAGSAGYDTGEQCCPVPYLDDICLEVYQPVVCGSCEYSNGCYAGKAGYDAGIECCPKPFQEPIGGGCPKDYNPVVCGSCEYDNACIAGLAGFDAKNDCVEKNPQCPIESPEPNSNCGSTDLNCKYGEECCNKLDGGICKNQCSHSLDCTCVDNKWACLVTDFCNIFPPECEINGNVFGDPHFKTWVGEKYDFHGICDLVLLKNPAFEKETGMDIHVRSKRTKQWSYISTAVVRIGDETFEVAGKKDGNTFWINKKKASNDDTFLKEGMSIAGYPISYREVNTQQKEYTIDLDNEQKILIRTWKNFVRVEVVNPTMKNFGKSLGLMGSYPDGVKLARNGSTILNETIEFGREWQVQGLEQNFFHTIEGPQYPSRCEIPTKATLRRRLADIQVSKEAAEAACTSVAESERDMCVFDVMVTGNTDVAIGAY